MAPGVWSPHGSRGVESAWLQQSVWGAGQNVLGAPAECVWAGEFACLFDSDKACQLTRVLWR